MTDETGLPGDLLLPADAMGLVVFAQEAGSARRNPHLRLIARSLLQRGLGVLLADPNEEDDEIDGIPHTNQPDATASRLGSLVLQAATHRRTRHLRIGIFASRGGTAAALLTAAQQTSPIHALVSYSGSPECAAQALPKVSAPTLLIVGGNDKARVEAHRKIHGSMNRKSLLQVVAGAGPHFHEPGKLDQVASMACLWFRRHLAAG